MNQTNGIRLSALDAAHQVLAEAQQPLHYREICHRMLEQKLWQTRGRTPEATLNARLAMHIKDEGAQCRFIRTAPGTFALNPDHPGATNDEGPQDGTEVHSPTPSPMSFTEAAAHILEHYADRKPMHYRDITERALQLGILVSSGRTPEATMYSQILAEVQRQTKRGEVPRFTKPDGGYVGLAKWAGRGLVREIEAQNRRVRAQLHQHLTEMDPIAFEGLTGRLLAALGFEGIEVTSAKGDGGIDVRGTLVVGEAIRVRMAVQVKRWKHNVRAPVVQQVRGSLGAHEQGLIITTSGFSPGAREEAERADTTPVALMDGDQLVSVLIEHDIGVRRESYDLIELAGDDILTDGSDM